MAKCNYTYEYTGKVFPLSTLTSNQQIIELAGCLKRQAEKIADAHTIGKNFRYVPINIPANLVHIFGKQTKRKNDEKTLRRNDSTPQKARACEWTGD